jgi:uncharacterized protein (TIGR03435 family)
MTHLGLLFVGLALTALPLAAQPDARRFEVASIKPSAPGVQDMGGISGAAPEQFRTVNAPLERIILYAFGRRDYQLVGAPDWIRSERFDITAKYPAGHSPAQVPAMVRALLEDRFKLKTHVETREGPVYALVLGRADGKLGPDLKRPNVDCEAELAKQTGTRIIMAGTPCSAATYAEGLDRLIWGGNRTMAQLAAMLSAPAGRDVLDRTGLTGTFDARLRWRPDAGLTTAPDAQLTPNAGVSLFTAVQEQLGLKLESTRAPLEVLVIDSVERPTPN